MTVYVDNMPWQRRSEFRGAIGSPLRHLSAQARCPAPRYVRDHVATVRGHEPPPATHRPAGYSGGRVALAERTWYDWDWASPPVDRREAVNEERTAVRRKTARQKFYLVAAQDAVNERMLLGETIEDLVECLEHNARVDVDNDKDILEVTVAVRRTKKRAVLSWVVKTCGHEGRGTWKGKRCMFFAKDMVWMKRKRK